MGMREKQRCERKIFVLYYFEIVVSGGIGVSNDIGRNILYCNSCINCNQLICWFLYVFVQCLEIVFLGMINVVDNLLIQINLGFKNR